MSIDTYKFKFQGGLECIYTTKGNSLMLFANYS